MVASQSQRAWGLRWQVQTHNRSCSQCQGHRESCRVLACRPAILQHPYLFGNNNLWFGFWGWMHTRNCMVGRRSRGFLRPAWCILHVWWGAFCSLGQQRWFCWGQINCLWSTVQHLVWLVRVQLRCLRCGQMWQRHLGQSHDKWWFHVGVGW